MLDNSLELLRPLPHRPAGLKLTGVTNLNLEAEKPTIEAWWSPEGEQLQYQHLKVFHSCEDSYNLCATKVCGTWNVPRDCAIAKEHYPNDPMIPGVNVIEAMILVWSKMNADAGKLLKLDSIASAKFSGSVRPGDEVEFCVESLAQENGFVRLHGSAKVKGVLLSEATFSLIEGCHQRDDMVSDAVILEAIAQAGSVMGYASLGSDVLLKLVRVSNVRFFASAYVGERVDLNVTCDIIRMRGLFLTGCALVDEKVVASMNFAATSQQL